MLVLSRKAGERVIIGGAITVCVLDIHGDRVRLGFEAPKNIEVHREEIQRRKDMEAELVRKLSDEEDGKTIAASRGGEDGESHSAVGNAGDD